jgi:hypothetical protein
MPSLQDPVTGPYSEPDGSDPHSQALFLRYILIVCLQMRLKYS